MTIGARILQVKEEVATTTKEQLVRKKMGHPTKKGAKDMKTTNKKNVIEVANRMEKRRGYGKNLEERF